MGFMNVLKFSAACFDLLGWPLIALGYPLCASIWVIETKSISDIRKLVTYWVLFSLISLFDHAFSKLLEWIPFWPYIKLMVICWLVIPHFDGSSYVYQHLVNPCLSNSRENFLVAADRYSKENGAEALEKLLASKCEGPNAAKEIKMTEVTQRTFGGTAQWVKQTKINLGETKSNTACDVEIKERATALVADEIEACRDDRTPEVPLHKNVQKEWACAVCQVTTKSEATLNSHLQGKRHKATSEQLKARNQATKTNVSPSASMAKKSVQSTKEEQPKCTSNNLKSKNNGKSAASTVNKPDKTKDDEQQKCASSNRLNQKNNKKQEEKVLVSETNEQGHQKNSKQSGSGKKELGSWCNICNVSCTSELDMASHLNGRSHFNRIKQLSELWCSNCNVKCNRKVDMDSHLNGRRHLEQLKERSGLWCSICSVNCNSEVDMDSHLNGRRHLDQIKEQLRLWCGACNLICNSEAKMASHLNGKRHLEKKRDI